VHNLVQSIVGSEVTIVKRGDEIQVRDWKGTVLRRVVWEDAGVGVLVCTPEAYARYLNEGVEPNYMGFPKDDIVVPEHSPPANRRGPATEHGEVRKHGRGLRAGD
jgi:hypothetical protein